MYKKQVDKEFKKLEVSYQSKSTKWTSCYVVLLYMFENKNKIWFWSWELTNVMTKNGYLISHRGCARASDLANYNPELVEMRKIGRFSLFRCRRENQEKIVKYLKNNI